MINGIGSTTGAGRIDGTRPQGTQRAGAAASARAGAGEEGVAASPAAELAAAGPPVDTDKVARVRAAIASGGYAIDVQAIAAKMVALDLPGK